MISSALRSVLGKDQESLKAEVRTHPSLVLTHTFSFEDSEAVLPGASASPRTEPNPHPKSNKCACFVGRPALRECLFL